MHKNNKSSFDTIEKINDYLLANKSLPDGAIQAAADWMGRPIYVWQWPELYYGDWEKNGKTKALIPFRPGNTNIQKNVFLPNGPISAPDAQAIHLFALVWGTKEAPGGGHCEFLVDEAAPLNSVSNLNLLQLFANNSDSIFENCKNDPDLLAAASLDMRYRLEVCILSLAAQLGINDVEDQTLTSMSEYLFRFQKEGIPLVKIKDCVDKIRGALLKAVLSSSDKDHHYTVLKQALLWDSPHKQYKWLNLGLKSSVKNKIIRRLWRLENPTARDGIQNLPEGKSSEDEDFFIDPDGSAVFASHADQDSFPSLERGVAQVLRRAGYSGVTEKEFTFKGDAVPNLGAGEYYQKSFSFDTDKSESIRALAQKFGISIMLTRPRSYNQKINIGGKSLKFSGTYETKLYGSRKKENAFFSSCFYC